jgi:hypothetical protein
MKKKDIKLSGIKKKTAANKTKKHKKKSVPTKNYKAKSKKSATKIHSRDEVFKIFSELTTDHIFSVTINDDNSKTLNWITNNFKKEMGFPFENLLSKKNWRKYLHEEDHDVILAMSRSIYQNVPTSAEFRIVKRSGSISWQKAFLKPVFDRKRKKVTGYYGSLEDITDKKKIELDLTKLNSELEHRVEEKTSQLESAILNLKHEVSIRTVAENQVRESEKIVRNVARNLDQKLRESEYKHLWNVFEHSAIATAIIAQNGICLNYNRAAEKLLGYTHEELPNIEAWLTKLIPSESYRKRARRITYYFIEKEITSQHFEIFVTTKSGEVKHLILQVNNILHDGVPVGVLLGQFIDISAQRKAKQTINQIAEGISTKTGQEFFDALVLNLAKAANADMALIVKSDETNPEIVKSLAAHGVGKKGENITYMLSGTPCENVFDKELCIYPSGVADLFPQDKMLSEMQIEGYAGVPLFSSSGMPLGLLIVLSKKPFGNAAFIRKILTIFSARAATEMERQQTLAALSISENRFRIISEQTGDLIYEFDLENDTIFRDGDIKAVLGYEKEEYQKLTKEELLNLVHPDDRDDFIRQNLEAIENQRKILLTFRHKHKDGSYLTLEQSGIAIKGENGKTKRFLGRLKDISHDRARDKQIDLQVTLLNSASDSIVLLNQNMNIIYANDRACEILAFPRVELLNRNIKVISPSLSEEKLEEIINQINKNGGCVFETEYRRKDGAVLPVEINSKIITIEGVEYFLNVARDISERRDTEKKLFDSEKRYRMIVEQSPEAIFVHNNGEFLFANQATFDLAGVKDFDELKKKKIIDYLHPDSVEPMLKRVSILNKREVDNIPYAEYKLIKNNGTLVYIESTASAIEFYGLRAIQSVARDITERKRAERALKESQERFQYVVEYSPNAIIIHQNGKVVYGNPAAVKLVGAASIDEIIYKNVLDFVHPDYKTFVVERIKSAAMSMKPLPAAEEKIICLDGKVVDVEIVSVPFYLNNSVAFQLIIRDITEIKSKSEELKKLSRAVEQNSASVTITNYEGEIEYVNPKFLEVTGYTLEEVIGKNPRILKSGKQSDEFYKSMWHTIAAGNEWRGEFQNIKKNGEFFWEFASISPIKNSQGKITHFVAIKEDITERKKFDDEMLIVKEEAEHAYKVKTSLLANMSHELRTPLNGIIGFSQLLKDYVTDEEGLKMVEKIIKSGQRLSNTFTEILSLSELEMGDVEIKNAPIDLALLCKELKLFFADRATAKNLYFEVELAFESQVTYTDEGWIGRIATHLIDNAIKFTSHGGITIQLSKPVIKNSVEYAVINIIDTGLGIKKEEHKSIFKEFKQLSEGTRRDFEGLGLGLSLSKRIAQNLNCLITFESEFEKGSTFSILIPLLSEIPLEKEMPEPEMINKVSNLAPVQSDKSLSILLVEDNPLNIEVVERFLARAGEVTSVRTGELAVKAAKEKIFDLLLVDISLGHGIDGIEVLKQIRLIENYATVPAIALTGYVSETNKRRFQLAGFNGFLGKPFEKKELLNYISKMFAEQSN